MTTINYRDAIGRYYHKRPEPLDSHRELKAMTRPRADWKPFYNALKSHDMCLFRRCVQCGEGVALSHNLELKVASDIEVAIVYSVCDALGLEPSFAQEPKP